jgi:hypothetical protein
LATLRARDSGDPKPEFNILKRGQPWIEGIIALKYYHAIYPWTCDTLIVNPHLTASRPFKTCQ